MTEDTLIENLERLLEQGQDDALLRFSLGSAKLKKGETGSAIEHLRLAVEHDPQYSAAWKLYGKALAEAGHTDDAQAAYRQGIEVATQRGDQQAVKEMEVFLNRLAKAS